jgi:hypothetical protein
MIDPLAAVLTEPALASLDARIAQAVDTRLRELLPDELERARSSPWLDTKAAAAYLTITENALRLRVRAGLVEAHRDRAGRLRFHRNELDREMTRDYPRRARR